MSWPNDYISGSARVLPTVDSTTDHIFVLSSDPTYTIGEVVYPTYSTIALWLANQVSAIDLVANASGEILVIPEGVAHTETANQANGLELNPLTSSSVFFPLIVGESAINKPSIQVSNDTEDGGGNIIAVTLNGYSKIYDCCVGLTSVTPPSGTGMCINMNEDSMIIGCTNNDIDYPSCVNALLIVHSNQASLLPSCINCAVDSSKTIDIGSCPLVGFFSYGSIFYNCVCNQAVIGFYVLINSSTLVNCCAQENTSQNIIADGGGSFSQTTCAIEQELIFSYDGYSLFMEDNQGTDMSSDPTYPFTDDIWGREWTTWDRASNNSTMLPNVWPHCYVEGTARRLPNIPVKDWTDHVFVLSDSTGVYNIGGVDYQTYQTVDSWIYDKIFPFNLTCGEILIVPTGTNHVEEKTRAGFVAFPLEPLSDSEDYFACIVGEDPSNKPSIQITNNVPLNFQVYSFSLSLHSVIYDCCVGLTTNEDLNGMAPIMLSDDHVGNIIGCTNNDIICSNLTQFALFILNSGSGGIIDCAIDNSKTINIGSGTIAGFLLAAGSSNNYAYNCVANNLNIGFLTTTSTATIINCCGQGNVYMTLPMNFFETGSGTFIKITCADEQGLIFDSDDYTLLYEDGQGTDMSSEPIYSYTDDIFGVLWTTWDRASNNATTPFPISENAVALLTCF